MNENKISNKIDYYPKSIQIILFMINKRIKLLIKLLSILFLPNKTIDFVKYKINKYKEEYKISKDLLLVIYNLKKIKNHFTNFK